MLVRKNTPQHPHIQVHWVSHDHIYTMNKLLEPWDNDIFLSLRPFPSNPESYFAAHWHEIVASFFLYQLLYKVSPVMCQGIFGDFYTLNSSRKTRLNFDIHVVSMVQCILSILLLAPMINHDNLSDNPVFGYTPYGGLVASLTCGYFIWDVIICVQHYKMFGMGFLMHAFAALYVFLLSFKPFCQPWIPGFLIFELSTPFVNINWFLSRLPAGFAPGWMVVVNGLLLMFTFFSVRIVWGFYAIWLVAKDLFHERDNLAIWLPCSVIILNFGLNMLNVYWFVKMVQIAKKKMAAHEKA